MGGAATSAKGRMLSVTALVGLGLLAAAPGAAARPEPLSVEKSVRVSASGVTALTLRCPQGATALAGAVTSTSTGVNARDSVPRDAGRWTFRFTALSGARSPRARAELRCIRISRAAGVRSWRITSFTGRRTVRVQALATRGVRVRCMRGFISTGYGLDRSAPEPVGPLPSGDVQLSAAVPTGNGYLFRLENTGGDPTRVTLRIRCLGRVATGRRGGANVRQEFEVDRAGFVDRVSSGGRRTLRHRCPAGRFSLAAGFSLDARDDIFLTGAHPAAMRSGTWSFNHPSGAGETVRTYLSCLNLSTGFR
jgi:hypothetical protein